MSAAAVQSPCASPPSPRVWQPLWPQVEPLLCAAQPGGKLPTPNGEGWIGPIRSPLREDHNPSFSVLPDSETVAGAWKDHGTGDHGSMADLARRLGREVDGYSTARSVARPAPTLALFAETRHLDLKRLTDWWRVREVVYENRPALRFLTRLGVDRIKYLDGAKPKNTWAGKGGRAHAYGLGDAKSIGGERLHIVNGEPSVWAASQVKVAAVCFCIGEGTAPSDEVIAELRDSGFKRFAVVYDLDRAGRDGARKAVEALRAAGLDAVALSLPADLGEHGDVDDLHRRAGVRLGEVLAGLPELSEDSTLGEPLNKAERGTVAAAVAPLKNLEASSFTDSELGEALASFTTQAKKLTQVDREIARNSAVEACKALGIPSPARLVDAAMPPKPPAGGEGSGSAPFLKNPEPWPSEVDGQKLIGDLVSIVRRHVVLESDQALAVALWMLFTHSHEASTISPILAAVSPEKRCGKTTLLNLLSAVVPRPLLSANITPAAVFRAIEKYAPTLLVDEADTFLKDSEDLRGILNSGHHRVSARVLRCDGDNNDVKAFSTWAPKAIACIGTLPTTLEDRAIVITMRRKAEGESVERLPFERLDDYGHLSQQAARWAADNLERIRCADPPVPDGISSDRARDNWRPLLAIADTAGGQWPRQSRDAATKLAGREVDSESHGVMVLTDLKKMFDEHGTSQLATDTIVEQLRADAERPWADMAHGKGLTPQSLARLLRPFGVRPTKWRDDADTRRGYDRKDLEDAFARYTRGIEPPQPPRSSGSTTYGEFKLPQQSNSVAVSMSRNSNLINDVADVAVWEGGTPAEYVEVAL
jgi:hypothetical protein